MVKYSYEKIHLPKEEIVLELDKPLIRSLRK